MAALRRAIATRRARERAVGTAEIPIAESHRPYLAQRRRTTKGAVFGCEIERDRAGTKAVVPDFVVNSQPI